MANSALTQACGIVRRSTRFCMSRKQGHLAVAGIFALALSACASPMTQDANSLKSALAGDPVEVTQQGNNSITLTSSADYLYPSGGWKLRPDAPVLSKMVPTLSKLQNTNITVTGYTDNTPVGPQLQRMGIANNQDLSLKRAQTAVDFFKSQGVNPSLLSARGMGDANPVAPNDTPEGRAKNRRIEIALAGSGS
ncbi:MAG: OmpA family protein [Acetobacteraceae bacterium]|nr:OmpA family protein [Acetobacteraceae bacterium]